MWVPVAVWQPCELLYTCYLLKVQCSAFFPTEFGGYLLQSVVSVSSLASELTQVWLSTQRDSSGVALQQSCPWVGLGQSADGLSWVGSHKMDLWTNLHCIDWAWNRVPLRLHFSNKKEYNTLTDAKNVVTIRYNTRCYFNVHSKADISQRNLPQVTKN